jgi:hypothetical protein
VRADGELVLGEEVADAVLAREHVEVVQPEVGDHLLQLPLAHDCAPDARRLQLAEEPVRLAAAARSSTGVARARGRRRGARVRAAFRGGGEARHRRPPREQLPRRRVRREHGRARRLERREAADERLGARVRDALGVQLLVDPPVDSGRPHPLRIARPGAEGEARERVPHLHVAVSSRAAAWYVAAARASASSAAARRGATAVACVVRGPRAQAPRTTRAASARTAGVWRADGTRGGVRDGRRRGDGA